MVGNMAETRDRSSKRLEDLEEEITCAVCHGHYQEAKLLPCMHYYCRMCIEELAKRSRGRPFPCPKCRKDTNLPSGGTAQLQSAFFVERMKDFYCKMAKAEEKAETVCEMCSDGKAVAFCCQCAGFICAECVKHHRKLRVFSGHKVATLEDLKKGGVKDIPVIETPLPKCPEHDDQVMTIFCFDCNCLICRDCTVFDHSGHKFNFLKKCAAESRKSLSESLTTLGKTRANIAAADEKVAATEAQVDAQEKEVCQMIKQSFDQLKSLLEQRETELLDRAITMAQEKKDTLRVQRKSLQMALAQVQSLVKYVELNLENASDRDIMSVHTQLQAKVEEEEKCGEQLSFEPATSANIAYDPPSPSVIPSDLGNVFNQETAAIIGELACTCDLHQPMQATIVAPTSQSSDIQAELKSLVDPALSVQADVIQKGVWIYDIICTPRIRGRHDLTVKVNGKDIVGSPFRVFVKIHPTQLGPAVRTITKLYHPYGIAINNKEQLVLADWWGEKIEIMERDGTWVQTIECDKFQHPCGVATSPDGSIYVTDDSACCLFKFNKDGTLITTVKNELDSPQFIKYIGSHLYVSDTDNNLVKIFDTNCKVIGVISTHECPNPCDITEGDDGLYVVGRGKVGVYTRAPNGEFQYYVNRHPTSVKLSVARGICFDSSGHLFVTQMGSGVEGVCVFKPSGEHVASFGLASSGVMKGPIGIVIDYDGFVYVCDTNKKVCVF